MKKIIIIIFFLTLSINSYASEKIKYYMCEPWPHNWPLRSSKDLPPCQGVLVDERTLKVEFFSSVIINGEEQGCNHDKVFQMNSDWKDFYKKSKGYPFTGKWDPTSTVKGVIYDEHPDRFVNPRVPALFWRLKYDRYPSFPEMEREWPCRRLKP